MNTADLEGLIGPGALREYETATEAEQFRIQRWASGLPELTDEAFRDLCVTVVSKGALSESRRSTAQEPYIKAAACIHEARRRREAEGHRPDCGGDDLYKEGYNQSLRNHGFECSDPNPCTCERGTTDGKGGA